jgi:ribulose-phosphate 3-epimerase
MKADLSLWSADLGDLRSAVRGLEPDAFHFDVSDNHFVPGLLFFPEIVKQLRPETKALFHVHLMTERPDTLIEVFADAGADWITVHEETAGAWEALEQVRRRGLRAGLALRLETPVEAARAFAGRIDSLLLLGTPAGVKGCGLDPQACPRLREARALGVELVADGGIRAVTVPLLREAGANWVVPGSLVFAAADPSAEVQKLRRLCED